MNDQTAELVVKSGLGCCCLFTLGGIIGLIMLFCSIHTLGPEEQVILEGSGRKYVRNGPQVVLLGPFRKKVFREATRLGPREYAVIKNSRTGVPRHEAGPKLLWLEAYDEIQDLKRMVVLQLQEYTRLIDSMTGSERVVVGPAILVPEPLEHAPNGTEKAIVLGLDASLLTLNKTTGLLRLVDKIGVFYPQPYEVILQERKDTLLTHRQYALVKNQLSGMFRHEVGPKLLKLGAYDALINVRDKVVLQKDQYVVLKDQKTGDQRVVKGPQTLVPEPSETYTGTLKAAFLDVDTALLVLNRKTGQQRLVATHGVFFPQADEQIIETRNLIRLYPHQAVALRDAAGRVAIHNGAEGTVSFFLPPYTQMVESMWSDFSHVPVAGKQQVIQKVPVSIIDLRTRKIFFSYEVPTNDNVKLLLDGTIFWKVTDVAKMMDTTSDPEGDIWHHSRSALIQAVSKITLQNFMASFNNITTDAFNAQAADGFYDERGVMLISMEITRFECVEQSTAAILQQIIQETTNRINRLQVQQSSNDVKALKLAADIQLERQRTALIQSKAVNAKLTAAMQGDADGLKRVHGAAAFIGGLNNSVPDAAQRLALYTMHEKLASKNKDTQNLAAGNARLFLTPADLSLNTL
jgi:regulator of protease activity HflC (stomatin/prohibitin superfamily)